MKPEETYFLTINEFAEELKIHHKTVRNMIKSGRLAAFRTSNKKKASYRIARSELQRLVLLDLDEVYKKIHEK